MVGSKDIKLLGVSDELDEGLKEGKHVGEGDER